MRILGSLLLATWWLTAALAGSPPSPTLLWKTELAGRIYTSPVVCELLPSPGREIVVCSAESREVVCLDATGKVRWRFTPGFTARLTATPAAADVDQNGKLELFVAGGGGQLVCLEADGTLKWRRALVGEVEWSGPVVADLEGDGRLEVTVGTTAGRLYCFTARDGEPCWQRELGAGLSGLHAVADVDGDGKRELLVPAGRALLCLAADGATRWEFTQPAACNAACVGDLDGDSRYEILAAFDDRRLACLGPDGKCRWLHVGGSVGGGENWLTSPALVRSGKQAYAVVADGGGGVRAVDARGEELWYYSHGQPAGEAPVAGDLDGDGQIEVLVGFDDDGTVLCLENGPRVGWRFMADFRVVASPTVADLNDDGRLEVLVASNDNCLYCLQPWPRRPGVVSWPMRRADLAQSGFLP